MSRLIMTFLIGLCILPTCLAQATQLELFGKPFNVLGYMTQSVQIGIAGDHYDTEADVQQMLFNAFLEADYKPKSDLSLYVSSLLTMDLVYPIKEHDSSWQKKLFNKSRDKLFLDDEYWELLKEAHATWTPGPFLFRAGKQIVSWGEMDFFRIMDQINPLDQRRGFSDVEFESTLIPIWLARAEWWPTLQVGWLEELGIQFVFNPNADFISDQNPAPGNDAGGIWAPAFLLDNPLFPAGLGTRRMYVGSIDERLDRPAEWDPEGFEYGVRVSTRIKGSLLTLNGFYGRENSPSDLLAGFVPDPTLSAQLGFPVPLLTRASDGKSIIHPIYNGFFPRQKFLGATWSGDLPVRFSPLGGVSPVLRLEARYQFDKLFTDEAQAFYCGSDLLDVGIGIDWKIKITALNPRAYFTVSPQFFAGRIMEYPNDFKLNDLPDENNYAFTTVVSTSYLNGKLSPSLAWARDISKSGDLIIPKLTWSPTADYDLIAEAGIMGGDDRNTSYWLFRNKDYFCLKLRYKWN